MRIKVEVVENVAILHAKGKWMGGPDLDLVKATQRQQLENGVKDFIINLAGVSWLNSSGMGSIISFFVAAKGAGGKTVIAAPSDRLEGIFMVTKLNHVFEIYNSVEEAIASFGKAVD